MGHIYSQKFEVQMIFENEICEILIAFNHCHTLITAWSVIFRNVMEFELFMYVP